MSDSEINGEVQRITDRLKARVAELEAQKARLEKALANLQAFKLQAYGCGNPTCQFFAMN